MLEIYGAAAGSFYPADRIALNDSIKKYLKFGNQVHIFSRFLIAPHAGYIYSGLTQAYTYNNINFSNFNTVIITGISHSVFFSGISIPTEDSIYISPNGKLQLDLHTAQKICNGFDFIKYNKNADQNEHSIAVQYPFINYLKEKEKKDIKIVPILLGLTSFETIELLAHRIADIMEKDNKILFIASTDLVHYPVYKKAQQTDEKTIQYLMSLDIEGLNEYEKKIRIAQGKDNIHTALCGIKAVTLLMKICQILEIKTAKLLDYRNSGDTAGSKDQCVGYCSMLFY